MGPQIDADDAFDPEPVVADSTTLITDESIPRVKAGKQVVVGHVDKDELDTKASTGSQYDSCDGIETVRRVSIGITESPNGDENSLTYENTDISDPDDWIAVIRLKEDEVRSRKTVNSRWFRSNTVSYSHHYYTHRGKEYAAIAATSDDISEAVTWAFNEVIRMMDKKKQNQNEAEATKERAAAEFDDVVEDLDFSKIGDYTEFEW